MIHIDLFSGIGGFSYAVDEVWNDEKVTHIFCDIDPFCQAVIRKHWPGSKIYGDIRELIRDAESERYSKVGEIQKGHNSDSIGSDRNDESEITADAESRRCNRFKYGEEQKTKRNRGSFENIDILTGGFPCQPFSHAGKRRGRDDNRYLWPEMLEVIRNTRPRWVIAENVRGILSIESGLVFEQVCSDMEKEGYAVWPFIIPAASVNAPHRRDRVWIIGHLGNARSETFDSEKPRLSEISESRRSDKIIKSDAPDSESFRSGGSACGQCGDGERTILSQERERSEMGRESEGCAEYAPDSENVGNSKGTGQSSINNRQGKAQYGRASSGFDRQEWQKDWPQVASALCDVAYGLPRELVRPDGSRDRNYPWWRIQALKAGGNSIVPQVAVNIMKAIKESDKK